MIQPIKIQLKSPKLLSQRIRKRYYKTLETSVINSSLSSLSEFDVAFELLEGISNTKLLSFSAAASKFELNGLQTTRILQVSVNAYYYLLLLLYNTVQNCFSYKFPKFFLGLKKAKSY